MSNLKPPMMPHYLDMHVWVTQQMRGKGATIIESVADTLWAAQIQGELDAWVDRVEASEQRAA